MAKRSHDWGRTVEAQAHSTPEIKSIRRSNQYSQIPREDIYIVFKGGLIETPCCDIVFGLHSAHFPVLDGDDEEDD